MKKPITLRQRRKEYAIKKIIASLTKPKKMRGVYSRWINEGAQIMGSFLKKFKKD